MDKADRGVSQPNETRVSKGEKVGGKFLLDHHPSIGKGRYGMAGNTFFFGDNSIRYGFAFSQRTLHKLQSKAEVATESCEGKVAACFCQGYRISGMDHIHISHLLTHKRLVDEYQGEVVTPRGPRKAVDADHRSP
jgi:hypothetical protein